MVQGGQHERGLEALRRAVARVLLTTDPLPAGAYPPGTLLNAATSSTGPAGPGTPLGGPSGPGNHGDHGDHGEAASSAVDESERSRLIALVELARGGDAEAFGMLFDHYHPQVYRFLYHRTRSVPLAEDLTSETFFRALRRMPDFRWQGKDFGAWLMTIARNLTVDHFKSGRVRMESTTEDMSRHDDVTESTEDAVLANLTHEVLLDALHQLSDEQRDCLVMRFLQGLSIAETAAVLGRSDGAVKQLQLRGVRNLAKLLPEDLR